MFCKNCGEKIEEGAKFCIKCGRSFNEKQGEAKSVGMNVNSSKRNIGIVVMIAIVIIIFISAFSFYGGSDYKSIIKKYFTAYEKADGKSMIELAPEDAINRAIQSEEMSEEQLVELLEEVIGEHFDVYDESYGKNWKFSYEIQKEEKVYSNDLDNIREYYAECNIEVEEAIKFTVNLKIEGEKTKDETEKELMIIKVGNKWYLDDNAIWDMV